MYELFCRPQRTGEGDAATQLCRAEARIAALERAVGAGASGGGGGGGSNATATALQATGEDEPLFGALARLERRAAALDRGNMDKLRLRAKMLRTELEATAGAAAAQGSAVQNAENGARIEALYARLGEWDGISAELPNIVSRLQSLQDIHEQVSARCSTKDGFAAERAAACLFCFLFFSDPPRRPFVNHRARSSVSVFTTLRPGRRPCRVCSSQTRLCSRRWRRASPRTSRPCRLMWPLSTSESPRSSNNGANEK